MPIDPGALKIVHYPHPVLLKRAGAIESVTSEVRGVAERMIELMFEAHGIGLAAPQVGLPWRMFVVHVPALSHEDADKTHPPRSPDDSPPTATREPMVFINPRLSNPAGKVAPYEEGCLSLPEIVGDVLRPEQITIAAKDLEGREFTMTAGGLLARCFQHEYDHLEGILIINKMTQMSRLKNRAAIRHLESGR